MRTTHRRKPLEPANRSAGGEWPGLKDDDGKRGEAPVCPGCGKRVGPYEWLPPFRVELETWGRVYGDIAFCTGDLLVSGRFKNIYETTGLAGLSGFASVEIVKLVRHRKIPGERPRYFKADVVRMRAAVDQEASGFEWEDEKPSCPVCREGGIIQRWKRLVIEPGTWSAEDIFVPRGLEDRVLTQRFTDICEAYLGQLLRATLGTRPQHLVVPTRPDHKIRPPHRPMCTARSACNASKLPEGSATEIPYTPTAPNHARRATAAARNPESRTENGRSREATRSTAKASLVARPRV